MVVSEALGPNAELMAGPADHHMLQWRLKGDAKLGPGHKLSKTDNYTKPLADMSEEEWVAEIRQTSNDNEDRKPYDHDGFKHDDKQGQARRAGGKAQRGKE